MNDKKAAIERKKDIVFGRVKELRESKQLTQLEFAESIDVSSNTISRIERKEMSLSSDIALRIADVYDISLDWLFYRSDERISPKTKEKMRETLRFLEETTTPQKSLKINKKTPSD
jgi:Predicted transcriptional regulators